MGAEGQQGEGEPGDPQIERAGLDGERQRASGGQRQEELELQAPLAPAQRARNEQQHGGRDQGDDAAGRPVLARNCRQKGEEEQEACFDRGAKAEEAGRRKRQVRHVILETIEDHKLVQGPFRRHRRCLPKQDNIPHSLCGPRQAVTGWPT